MFPEHRTLISKLKGKHYRFDQLFEKHNKLDNDIKQLENIPGNHAEITQIKMDKL